jgi:hypothetical protein
MSIGTGSDRPHVRRASLRTMIIVSVLVAAAGCTSRVTNGTGSAPPR